MTIGARVRREREKRGWTVRELARRAAVSPGAVSKLEGVSNLLIRIREKGQTHSD